MTKIMLVEDDKSLREIYGVRLLAEGYDIVSAGDGEEALAMAIKERPALIVTDVMMPRISGFDMLDILRSTTETRNIKVIMMTALSSEDQRRHGEQLGADRYLVKSQVGIEDVVRVVHEVLGDAPTSVPPAAAPPSVNPVSAATTPPARPSVPPTVQAAPTPQPRPMPAPTPQAATSIPPHAATVHTTMPPARTATPAAPSTRQRVIQPINDPTAKIDINNLLDKELAREAGMNIDKVATTQQERALVTDQLNHTVPGAKLPPIAPMQPQSQPAAQTPQPTPPASVQAQPAAPPSAPAVPPAPPIPQRPPVQPPQRPNVAPIQPRQDIPPAA